MSLIKNFQEYGNHLTELEVECFHKLLSFQDLQPKLTISSLSEALNVSTTTIFRMVKKLNYKTFMDFRYDLLYHRRDEYEYTSKCDNVCDTIEKEIKDTMSMLRHLDIGKAIESIVQAKNVLVCSSGMNKYVAKILAVKLSLFGIRTIYPDDNWFLYLEANHLTSEDFVIVISRGGETKDIIDVMKTAKMNGCQILLISEKINSTMSKLSDYTVNVSVSKDEGYDIDSRLHMHLAIEYLLRELVNQHLYSKKYL